MPSISAAEKAKRLRRLEILLYQGKSPRKIAEALGVRRETVWRYLAGRQTEVEAFKPEQRALLRQELINRCLRRLSAVEAAISDETDVTVIMHGQDVLTRIERRLSAIIGADEPTRHQVLHANINGRRSNGSGSQEIQAPGNGTVNIIFEDFTGGDPDFVPGHRVISAHDADAINLDNE